MFRTILLYGADEYLGRLFVAGAVAAWKVPNTPVTYSLIVSGRDTARTQALAQQYGLAVRHLDLQQPNQIVQQLDDVDVLVNAASPFADTGVVLAQAAFRAPCHVVDLNPEVDVFRKLERLKGDATLAKCALVRSAGPGAVASALMVRAAVAQLTAINALDERCIGAIRIGVECVVDFSRSSAASVLRGLACDVTIMRAVTIPIPGSTDGHVEMRCDHVPIGMLERQFDFSVNDGTAPPATDIRIASAAGLVDTLAASFEIELDDKLAGTIESYVSVTTAGRIGYQVGAGVAGFCEPIGKTAFGKNLANCANGALSDAPLETHSLRTHTIVLDIEDEERTRIVDWRLRTPDFYVVGARAALAVTEAVAAEAPAGSGFFGLKSPAELLVDVDLAGKIPQYGRALRECFIDKRILQ